jgi:hypothetical protein
MNKIAILLISFIAALFISAGLMTLIYAEGQNKVMSLIFLGFGAWALWDAFHLKK